MSETKNAMLMCQRALRADRRVVGGLASQNTPTHRRFGPVVNEQRSMFTGSFAPLLIDNCGDWGEGVNE